MLKKYHPRHTDVSLLIFDGAGLLTVAQDKDWWRV